MSRKDASKKFSEQPWAFWQAEFLCRPFLPATVRADEFDHKSTDWVPATDVWRQTTGFKPERDKMQAHSERVREVFSRPTPRVDAIVAEVEKARRRRFEWNPKTQTWEKPDVRQPEKQPVRQRPVMAVDIIRKLFPGTRTVGPEPTPEQWREIEAEAARWHRLPDGTLRRVKAARPACAHCGGPIIEARWPNRAVLQCHYCGRTDVAATKNHEAMK
jgi:hypothetical protein